MPATVEHIIVIIFYPKMPLDLILGAPMPAGVLEGMFTELTKTVTRAKAAKYRVGDIE